jgi:hypothetical protein
VGRIAGWTRVDQDVGRVRIGGEEALQRFRGGLGADAEDEVGRQVSRGFRVAKEGVVAIDDVGAVVGAEAESGEGIGQDGVAGRGGEGGGSVWYVGRSAGAADDEAAVVAADGCGQIGNVVTLRGQVVGQRCRASWRGDAGGGRRLRRPRPSPEAAVPETES